VSRDRLMGRVSGVLLLRRAAFEQVRDDARGTAPALLIVAAVAVAHGAADSFRAEFVETEFESNPKTAWLFGLPAELAFWIVASSVVFLVGRIVGGTGSYPEVVRAMGFASAPGILIAVAAVASSLAPAPVVLVPIVVWRLAAYFLAVRYALRLGRWRALITLLISVGAGLAAVVVLTGLLNTAIQ